ncbi:hypothetical protein ABPG74_007578 [Tetrahymena malaccensis]
MNKKSLFSALLFLGLISCCIDNSTSYNIKGQDYCFCNQGYYGNTQAGQTCQQCPQGTTSNPAEQHNNYSIGFCSNCLQNYYKKSLAVQDDTRRFLQTDSAAVCIQCPNGSGNASGPIPAGDETQCNTCQPNYYMTAAVSKIQAAQCSPCPSGSGNKGVNSAGDLSLCNQCQDNFYMTATATSGKGASSAQCSPCPPNSYSTAPTSVGFCTCFDSNAIPLSSTQATCACLSGFAGNVATAKGQSGCQKCGLNQFVSGNTCVTCADGSTVNKDFTGCTCNDSSDGTMPWSSKTNSCQCKENYYGTPDKATQGQQGSCKQCPTGTSSKVGTKTSDQCTSASQKPPSDNTNPASQSFSEIINISLLISLVLTVFF